MERFYQYLPQQLVHFVLVTLFSLLIGLSQRRLTLRYNNDTTHFGTDRTFTFIGILGYLLYILDAKSLQPWAMGGAALVVLLSLNYYTRMKKHEEYGITTIVIALITYCMAPIVCTQPSWFYVMMVVTVLLLTELKRTFKAFAEKMQHDEMITLAKFLAISGIILPMLPQEPLFPAASNTLTPYTVWLATVVVSGISYFSYLLKRYVLHSSGILVSGFVGGLYSSTATISVLARKCKHAPVEELPQYVGAMLAAATMRYLRFLILIGIFSASMFGASLPVLGIMSVISIFSTWFISRQGKKVMRQEENSEELGISEIGLGQDIEEVENNPLEFKVALIFAGLFVLFTFITQWTLQYAGTGGLGLLSVLTGLSDITPFILNLLTNNSQVLTEGVIVTCILQAITSNLIVNMVYAFFFSGKRKEMLPLFYKGFFIIIVSNLLLLGGYYLWS